MNDPYRKIIPRREDGTSDIYDVIFAYKVSNPAVEHAIKKLLCPGVRGAKGVLQDLDEARKSIVRAIELEQHALVAVPEPINPARHQKERVQGARGTVFKCKECGDQFTSLDGCPSCARNLAAPVHIPTAHVADALRDCPACGSRYPAGQHCPTLGCPA